MRTVTSVTMPSNLRTRNDAQQIVALGLQMLAAQANHLARHQHHLDAQHIVGGEPIFQAMHPAEFSATLPPIEQRSGWTDRVRNRIRIGHRLRHAQIGHPRLGRDRPVDQIDIEDSG